LTDLVEKMGIFFPLGQLIISMAHGMQKLILVRSYREQENINWVSEPFVFCFFIIVVLGVHWDIHQSSYNIS
jgi:hypothetical protein